jgi:phosphoglycolate phosphatase-like HAD superfamily hydrolase
VIGDTTNDVTAALANGARAVGVATGSVTMEDLRQAGAHVVLPNLADVEAALQAITG